VAIDSEIGFSRLEIVNRSFEEGDANTLTGWGQDAPGERTFRDTTVWTRFPGQPEGSGASARVTSSDGKMTRIWQYFGREQFKRLWDTSGGTSSQYPFGPCERNTDYVLSFRWRSEALDGDLYVEACGIEPDGELGRTLPVTPLARLFPPEQFGESVAELSLSAPGETGLSQQVALSPAEQQRPWRVSVQVRVPQLTNGSVALCVQPGSDPETRRQVQELFAYYCGLGIEPIPVLQNFGHAYTQLKIDPNVAEGVWVVDEKLVLVGTDPVALAHPNVIRTESTDIQITDETGAQTFLEGPDYEVLGQTKYDDGRFSSEAALFQVRRTPASRIPDGATVLAGYDYVRRVNSSDSMSCPNEPRMYAILRQTIQDTIRILHPKYLHIGHDEVTWMGTDSRCRKSGRSNAENFAMEVWRLYEMAKAEDPNIRLMMWDDMINPYPHGFIHEDPTAPAADLLPKDIIQNVWFHGPSDPPTAGYKSLEFFATKGYTTTGGPWPTISNARRWSVACKRARDAGLPCIGILRQSWYGSYVGLEEAANTAWRVPAEP